ncbi:MAG: copper-binding protein [Nitrosopumilus sp.]|nr:copper-binding protein [Nitrosopumilus sp.]
MKYLFALLIVPLLLVPAFAESQTLPTEKGTLDVKLTYDEIQPNTQTKINIDFINPQTQKIQEHIDYSVTVLKDDETVFGPIPLTHTSVGSVKIPIEFNLGEGVYSMDFVVEGILFQPIPPETVSFDIAVGEANAQPISPPENEVNVNGENGGCLIATATYGSELAPQVQQLRELRDNTILSTKSGTAFMSTFNQFYYSFSPTVADLEREQPIFKEFMKITLTPMLTSLSLLNHANIDSEEEMLGYGISIVLLNIGMYIGVPIFGILKLYQFKKD